MTDDGSTWARDMYANRRYIKLIHGDQMWGAR